jgi:hypothetical protein
MENSSFSRFATLTLGLSKFQFFVIDFDREKLSLWSAPLTNSLDGAGVESSQPAAKVSSPGLP